MCSREGPRKPAQTPPEPLDIPKRDKVARRVVRVDGKQTRCCLRSCRTSTPQKSQAKRIAENCLRATAEGSPARTAQQSPRTACGSADEPPPSPRKNIRRGPPQTAHALRS